MTAFRLGNKGIFIENSTVRDTRRRRRTVAAACAVGVLFALTVKMSSPMLSRVFTPMWKIEEFVGAQIAPAFEGVVTHSDLVKERDELLAKLEAEQETTQILTSRIEDFEEIESLFLSGLSSEERSKIVVGHVLARPPVSPYDTLVIDVGENRNIKVDDLVYANSVTVIGRIREIKPTTAVVALYSSPGETVEVTLPDVSGTMRATGYGAGTISVTVPHGIEIATATPVYYAGSHTLVGYVGDSHPELREHAEQIFAQLPVPLRTISWVSIRSKE